MILAFVDRLIHALVAEPALLELVLLTAIGAVAAWWLLRLAHAVNDLRDRGTTDDLLAGGEALAQGNAGEAAPRLARVIAAEPENVAARVGYARALAVLGEFGEAHQQHVQLQRAFGHDTAPNRLALASTAFAAGRLDEALDYAHAAATRAPVAIAAWQIVLRSALRLGRFELAGEAAERVVDSPANALDEPARARARECGARAFARATDERLAAATVDDPAAFADARRLMSRAERLAPQTLEVWQSRLRLDYRERGERALTERLERQGDGDGWRSFGATPFRCTVCAGPLEDREPECGHCGARGSARVTEPALTVELDAPAHVLDAIEENQAHVQRLLERWLMAGDVTAREQLRTIGASAVPAIFERAILAGPSSDVFARALAVLCAMGVGVLGKLLAEFAQTAPQHRSIAAMAIGAVVREFGREGLAVVESVREVGIDADLRDMLIDCHASHAETFVTVIEVYAVVDIVRRLDRLPADRLRALIGALSRDVREFESLFADPTFSRDDVLWEAVVESPEAAPAIERVLALRGFHPALAQLLVDSLIDPSTAAAAGRLLDGYGARGHRAQLAAFADRSRSAAVRRAVGRRLVVAGAAVAPLLAECFAAGPGPLDEQVADLLVEIGDPGIAALVDLYRRELVRDGDATHSGVPRSAHRRQQIVRVLTGIGSLLAQRALLELCGEAGAPSDRSPIDSAKSTTRAPIDRPGDTK